MNGRNRSSGRTKRQMGSTTQEFVGHRQRFARYDRQRAQAPYRNWFVLPADVKHRYNVATLSSGGCF